ncbi:outer membrane beta-barrel protein [Ferruginivarius sediminum]|uniref:outer membrane beta-barrel protein n=1 Tax=Ferruginivarius sediminum TaxID=2661937 RepID=UPI0013799D12|nr:outer membrane beta-barrel protein [Ferruginivarius sediminum]
MTPALTALAVVVLLVSAAAPAFAQTARDLSVMRRPRPEFQPLCFLTDLGLTGEEGAGGFRVCPRVQVTGGYDDNVFRTEDDAEGDAFTRVSPRIALRSNWENHAVGVELRGDIERYADLTNNDWEDFELRGQGRLDVREDLYARATASVGRFHEDRDDPDAPPGVAGVNQFYKGEEGLQLTYQPTDLVFRLEGRARQIDWRKNGFIDNDDRDRHEYEVSFRAGMEYAEEFLFFVEPAYNIRRYRRDRDFEGFERDSQGFDVRAGVLYDVSGLTFLEASAGYFRQDFADRRFETADGVSVQVDMAWNPTELLTVNMGAGRSVEETTQLGVSSIVASRATLGFEYEIDYNLMFDTLGTFRRDDFEGGSRQDDNIFARAGLTYLMNEYLSWNARYLYARRSSSLAGNDFTSNTLLLTLRGQL